jgi:DNA-binding response OmpR family regulator
MSRTKILICDDIESIRRLAARIIENMGYLSTQAAAGQEAVDLLNQDPSIGLVLLYIVLPDLSGFDVMKEIQRIRRDQKRDIKVCFLSGKSTREDILKAIDLGGDDYVIKPVLSETLSNKIQSLLGLPKKSEFARISVMYGARLLEESILPDMFVTEFSEDDMSIRATAALKNGHQFKLRCADLGSICESDGHFVIRIQSCHRQRSGVYQIKADFVGLTEQLSTKLRAVAIRGAQNLVEPPEE